MFIGRNPDGTIYGTWSVPQWKGQEELPDDAAEVTAFRTRPTPDRKQAKRDALEAARTVEDLKTVLKNVLDLE